MKHVAQSVTFSAWRGDDFVPLIEVLMALGPWVLRACWRLRSCEFVPGWRGSDELNVMSNQVNPTPTAALVDLVADGVQMIGGDLYASECSQSEPFLVIRSIRGDEWEVTMQNGDALRALSDVFNGTLDPD